MLLQVANHASNPCVVDFINGIKDTHSILKGLFRREGWTEKKILFELETRS